MTLFATWCNSVRNDQGRKRLWKFTERAGGRDAIADDLPDIVRSHYDDMDRIAEDVRELGFEGAAALLGERLPRSARARSGELGELLATELVEEELDFNVPVRRLRYKDGREMALRGDDFVGLRVDQASVLYLLKGEAKSRAALSKPTIVEARTALSRDDGRPTATSLLFIADRLMESDDAQAALGRAIRNEVATRTIPPGRIEHALFTMSENAAPNALAIDLEAAGADRNHTVIHLQIDGHQEFIKATYERALALGDA